MGRSVDARFQIWELGLDFLDARPEAVELSRERVVLALVLGEERGNRLVVRDHGLAIAEVLRVVRLELGRQLRDLGADERVQLVGALPGFALVVLRNLGP